MIGPIENRAIELLIRSPDGTDVAAETADLPGNYVVGMDPIFSEPRREAYGAATAETNGTYYVGVRADSSIERVRRDRTLSPSEYKNWIPSIRISTERRRHPSK